MTSARYCLLIGAFQAKLWSGYWKCAKINRSSRLVEPEAYFAWLFSENRPSGRRGVEVRVDEDEAAFTLFVFLPEYW